MLHVVYTLTKILVASLVAGTILAHFGISSEHLATLSGLSAERVQELAQRVLAWALPNVTLGAIVIVPLWFLAVLFRPPRGNIDERVGPVFGKDHAHSSRRAARPAIRVSSDAATSTTATTAIITVHTALICGFTPSRTSE